MKTTASLQELADQSKSLLMSIELSKTGITKLDPAISEKEVLDTLAFCQEQGVSPQTAMEINKERRKKISQLCDT